MVTLNKPAQGNTNWYQSVTDNWTTIEPKLQLELIEKKVVASAMQGVTFSSLDGDTDEFYMLQYFIINGVASVINVEIRPNGSTTNVAYQLGSVAGTTFAGGSGTSNGEIIDVSASSQSYGTAYISASKANSKKRFWHHTGIRQLGAGSLNAYWGGNIWDDTAANITTLEVRTSNASGMGQNSVLVLYRVRTS